MARTWRALVAWEEEHIMNPSYFLFSILAKIGEALVAHAPQFMPILKREHKKDS